MMHNRVYFVFRWDDKYLVRKAVTPNLWRQNLMGLTGFQIEQLVPEQFKRGKVEGLALLDSLTLPISRQSIMALYILIQFKSHQPPELAELANEWDWLMVSEIHNAVHQGQVSSDVLRAIQNCEINRLTELSCLTQQDVDGGDGNGSGNDNRFGKYEWDNEWTKSQKEIAFQAGFGNRELQYLYEAYTRSIWPSSKMDFNGFKSFFLADFLKHNCSSTESLFRSFDTMKTGLLTFPEFVNGLSALQPKLAHGQLTGNIRTKYIFRYYSACPETGMKPAEKQILAKDILKFCPASKQKIMMKQNACMRDSKSSITEIDFLQMVGRLELRGTSSLLRLGQPTFPKLKDDIDNGMSSTTMNCANCQGIPNCDNQPSTSTANIDNQTSTSAANIVVAQRKPIATKEMEAQTEEDESLLREKMMESNENDENSLINESGSSFSGEYQLAHHSIKLTKSGPIMEPISSVAQAMTASAQLELDDIADSQLSDNLIGGLGAGASSSLNSDLNQSFAERMAKEGIENAEEMMKALRFFEYPYLVGDTGKSKTPFSWTSPDRYQLMRVGHNFIKLCRSVIELLRHNPRCVRLQSPTYVLGDVHGSFPDLKTCERTFWPLGPRFCPANILFLGDYVDRGKCGFEVVAYLFAQKVQAPNKFHLLRGNHELAYMHSTFNFRKDLINQFGNSMGDKVWKATNDVFNVLPLAATIDKKIFCLHGGIPEPELVTESDNLWECIDRIPCPLTMDTMKDCPLAWQLLWNDPVWTDDSTKLGGNGFGSNKRGGGARTFSADALDSFLETHRFSHVIRAHQVQEQGFQLRYSGRLLTVFSASRYCGGTNGSACVLVCNGKLSVLRLNLPSSTSLSHNHNNHPSPSNNGQQKLGEKRPAVKIEPPSPNHRLSISSSSGSNDSRKTIKESNGAAKRRAL